MDLEFLILFAQGPSTPQLFLFRQVHFLIVHASVAFICLNVCFCRLTGWAKKPGPV